MASAPRPAPVVSQFVVKVSNRCNLRCTYCYEYGQGDASWAAKPRMMSAATLAATGRWIRDHAVAAGLQSVDVVLHGGEPLVLGVERLRSVVSGLRTALADIPSVTIQVQTNGLLLGREMLELLLAENVSVGVSVDGGAVHHDRHRRAVRGASGHGRLLRALTLVSEPRFRPIFAGFLCVVDTANDPLEVYEELTRWSPPTIDLLLPTGQQVTGGTASRGTAGDWLIAVFDRWYAQPRMETNVVLFSEIINLVLGGTSRSTQVGLSPVGYLTVESDGAVRQSDTLKAVRPGLGELRLNVLDDPVESALERSEVRIRNSGLLGLGEECRACRIVDICGGGNYAHRYRRENGFGNRSYYCPDLFRLIEHVRSRVVADVDRLRVSA